jgi:methionine aminopeptidase
MSIESHADLDGLREVSRVTRLTLDALEDGVRTADRRLAAHYEHTLVITRGAPLVLTAA